MTTTRHRSRLALLRLLHELAALTDGDTIPVPRALLDAITTALGPYTACPCGTCGTLLVGRRHRAYCCDACRSRAYRARQRQQEEPRA